jgi:ACS family glucarate transporter-like MFS transporter
MKRFLVLLLLFLLSWITYLDRAAISSAKEAVAEELKLDDQSIGFVFSSFALGYALAQVPSGWFADRLGPRLALTIVVTGWSLFTGVTGLVGTLFWMIVVRFIFGVAEAGAYPGSARVFFNWFPTEQHGRANGLIFAGSRLGMAFAFPLLAWLLREFGWRSAFLILTAPGVIWAMIWFAWFRDHPPAELAPPRRPAEEQVALWKVFRSRAMLLAMGQYFCSNFTNFLSLSWMNPYLIQQYHLPRETAAWYTMMILLIGATSQSVAGVVTDALYTSRWRADSRRVPAVAGFTMSAIGLQAIRMADQPLEAVLGFSLAVFGAELTISPSWAFCIDLGGNKSGAVTGAMNMIGNLGSFVSANAFPFLQRIPSLSGAYFLTAALLNLLAAVMWTRMRSGIEAPGKPV